MLYLFGAATSDWSSRDLEWCSGREAAGVVDEVHEVVREVADEVDEVIRVADEVIEVLNAGVVTSSSPLEKSHP